MRPLAESPLLRKRTLFNAINTSTNQIIAYDTNTFAEKLRLNIDEVLTVDLISRDRLAHSAVNCSSILLYDVTMGTPSFLLRSERRGTWYSIMQDNVSMSQRRKGSSGPTIFPPTLSGLPSISAALLYGLDITADDSVLLVGQRTTGLTQGAFQKINLTTGVITNIVYPRPFSGDGSLDVAVASNGLALGTSGLIYQINPVTNAITQRSDSPGFGFSNVTPSQRRQDTALFSRRQPHLLIQRSRQYFRSRSRHT